MYHFSIKYDIQTDCRQNTLKSELKVFCLQSEIVTIFYKAIKNFGFSL